LRFARIPASTRLFRNHPIDTSQASSSRQLVFFGRNLSTGEATAARRRYIEGRDNVATREAIGAEASRIEEDSTYSSKSHFEAARMWGAMHLWLGIPIALLAGLSGVSALSDMPVSAAVIAFVVAGLTAVMTFLNPEKRAASHQAAGNQYLALRNRSRIFKNIKLPQAADDLASATRELEAISKQREELNSASPPVPRRAFLAARMGIEGGESKHEVDTASSAPRP